MLSRSEVPPFEINEHTGASEEIRLKYRYLDMRRKSIFDKIAFRAEMNQFTRNWFTASGFLEVQTPIFTVSSPEGARDYLILSRLHPGKFYALPQAPQQYKQLLMVGGVDKYFQVAPCFRDEDPRADRHSCEFYQIDCEMSFVDQEDVFWVAESFAKDLINTITPKKLVRGYEGIENMLEGKGIWSSPLENGELEGVSQKGIPHNVTPPNLPFSGEELGTFIRLTHKQSVDIFGSDKPDIRFDMHFEDFTADFADSGFSLFARTVADGGIVKAMKLEGKTLSRSEIDSLTEVAKSLGAGGLAYIIYEADGPKSPILKFFTGNELEAISQKLAPKVGDMIFFGAGDYKTTCKVLGGVRLACRDRFQLVDKNEIAFAWVTDFPMYELKDDGKYDFEHNPFSMPHGGLSAFE